MRHRDGTETHFTMRRSRRAAGAALALRAVGLGVTAAVVLGAALESVLWIDGKSLVTLTNRQGVSLWPEAATLLSSLAIIPVLMVLTAGVSVGHEFVTEDGRVIGRLNPGRPGEAARLRDASGREVLTLRWEPNRGRVPGMEDTITVLRRADGLTLLAGRPPQRWREFRKSISRVFEVRAIEGTTSLPRLRWERKWATGRAEMDFDVPAVGETEILTRLMLARELCLSV